VICEFNKPRGILICILIIVVLGFTAYSFVLGAPFKTLDDNISIVVNSDIQDLSNVKKIFTSSFFGDNHYYRPLVSFSYMLEYHFFGLNSFYYNLTNVILHLAIAVSVFFLVLLLFNDRMTAFFVSLLFAIHPVQWEPVANISGRASLLNGFFAVNAFFLFCFTQQRHKSVLLFIFSLIFAFLALLAKESAAMLPVLIFFYLIIFKKEKGPGPAGAFIKTAPYFVVVAAYVLIRNSLGITDVYTWRFAREWILGVLTFLRVSLTYLRLYFLPVDLHFDRAQMLFTDFLNGELLFTVAVFLILAVVLIKYRGKFSAGVLFFFCWFWIELFPVSQVVASIGVQPGFISAAEHFLYIASIGMFVLLVRGCQKLYQYNQKVKACSPRMFQLAVLFLLVFFMITTIQQNLYARHTISMVKQSLAYNPHNARMLYSLGFEMAQVGEFEKAEAYFRRSLAEEANKPIAMIGLGKALCDQGRFAQCIDVYESVRYPGKFKELLDENLRLSYKLLREHNREKGHPRTSMPIESTIISDEKINGSHP